MPNPCCPMYWCKKIIAKVYIVQIFWGKKTSTCFKDPFRACPPFKKQNLDRISGYFC